MRPHPPGCRASNCKFAGKTVKYTGIGAAPFVQDVPLWWHESSPALRHFTSDEEDLAVQLVAVSDVTRRDLRIVLLQSAWGSVIKSSRPSQEARHRMCVYRR